MTDDVDIDIATKLYNEQFVLINPEEYTQYLALVDGSAVREIYMNLFSWPPLVLDSTRKLCSRLYLKGESQEIDRILSSFTESYINQNPANVFQTTSFDKIYIIIYSLILLNTALHNPEVSKKNLITKQEYIKNTFDTFIQSKDKREKDKKLKSSSSLPVKSGNSSRTASGASNGVINGDVNEVGLKYVSDENVNTETVEKPKLVKNTTENADKAVDLSNSPSEETSSLNSSSTLNAPLDNLKIRDKVDENQFRDSDELSTPIKVIVPLDLGSIPTENGNTTHAYTEPTLPYAPPTSIPELNTLPSGHRNISNSSSSSRTSNATKPLSIQQKILIEQELSSYYDSLLANELQLKGISETFRPEFNAYRDLPTLSKKISSSSIWSTETDRSKRLVNPATPRIGFGRVLAGTNHSNGSSSGLTRHSNGSTGGLTRHSNSSNSSIFSKDSYSEADLFYDSSIFEIKTSDNDNGNRHLNDFDIDNYQDDFDLTLELKGSPYLKEGLLKLKILNNDANDNLQESNNNIPTNRFLSFFRTPSNPSTTQRTSLGSSNSIINRYQENFVVVSKGELSLYSFDPKIIKKHQQKLKKLNHQESSIDSEVGDGNWLKNSVELGKYNLCSTFAQLEKLTVVLGKKLIIWSLNFPKINKKQPKKFLFEAGTQDIALEFINTCNFWAAKITAIPTLEESISSIEYGWGNLDELIKKKDSFKKIKYIQKWELINKGVYLSNYIQSDDNSHTAMMKQFVKTFNYYNNLKKLYQEFQSLQNKFLTNFPQKAYGGSNYNRVLGNFECKVSEYRAELVKYKTYLVMLGYGLRLRFELGREGDEDEEHEALAVLVKGEIEKIFASIKDISRIIPTYQEHVEKSGGGSGANKELVKSPKSFTLTQYKHDEGSVSRLECAGTETIKEEDEPEEKDEVKAKD